MIHKIILMKKVKFIYILVLLSLLIGCSKKEEKINIENSSGLNIEVININEKKETAEIIVYVPDMVKCYEYAQKMCSDMDKNTEEYSENIVKYMKEASEEYLISNEMTVGIKKEDGEWSLMSENIDTYTNDTINTLFMEIMKSQGEIFIEYEEEQANEKNN